MNYLMLKKISLGFILGLFFPFQTNLKSLYMNNNNVFINVFIHKASLG